MPQKSEQNVLTQAPTADYSDRIKHLRAKLGLTQQALAERLGTSFATVNRWENAQTKPSQLSWTQLRQLEMAVAEEKTPYGIPKEEGPQKLDFTTQPEIVKILAEGKRLSYGHLMNPTFATEISSIDPLPHQRIAVYDHMLGQSRLRFLLADDAGAGKTIMSGLYIREMFSRRLLRRVLIVTPAGLLGNWRRELSTLFNLQFRILTGTDFRLDNPFIGENSDRVIISMDTLATQRAFGRIDDPKVIPYDLVIFDEAHKLTADRSADLRVRKTDRYCLAEALAGIRNTGDRWKLRWSAHHLLLLTATPHQGKDYPYYALWRLLEPEVLSTPEAFEEYPVEQRSSRFIRRTKEEMVYLDGRPLYPKRISDTLGYDLTQGDISEQKLYDETTDYLRYVYNKAKLLNREAARLAMSVFQRRLASSTFALLCSFERRIAKLDRLISDVQDGKITQEQLVIFQQRIHSDDDVLDTKTADDESSEDGMEENERAEDTLLQGVVAASLSDLLAEREQVKKLLNLARQVFDAGFESKFERLRELLLDPKYHNEKFIVFSEHRDTMKFIANKLGGMGYTDQVAQIHGGLSYVEREEQVERFRKPIDEGGARFLICTDAAGEGINLQLCWIMINYDVPWNPARLEQRMGRIHRYGQKHDPVIIMNLVAPSTREGKVLKTLLDKLEKIKRELQSDKVFDCIGRIFAEVSIREYMEMAVTEDASEVVRELDGKLTKEQIVALAAREKLLFGSGGDVAEELPRLRADLDQEVYFRLLPGYVQRYVDQAAPLVNLVLENNEEGWFSLDSARLGAIDPLLSTFEMYPEKVRSQLTFTRPKERDSAIWLHPGEPVFERFRQHVSDRLSNEGRRGAIFVDPTTEKPYLFHLASLTIVRKADHELADLSTDEILETRLVGVKQYEGSELALCPIEHLLLLKGGQGLPSSAQRMAVAANEEKEQARAFLAERVARVMALERKKNLLQTAPEREGFLQRGFDFQEAELAAARAKQGEKARSGNKKASDALDEVKRNQKELAARRENAIAVIRREPELVAVGPIEFIAHALVVPSSDPADIEQLETNVEMFAMKLATVFEEAAGAKVLDVHTPELALKANLSEHPGFDLLSLHLDGTKRCIEVKGRSGTAEVQMYDNEWAKACNLRNQYWLFVAYDCATPSPRLVRVQDPFGKLLARQFSSVRTQERTQTVSGVRIVPKQIMEAAEEMV
ncbi:MAG: DUF3883 domain-containing protein [Ignavibacteriae bacterium]|nr:DUF3883 domain-containing protein [Ignavibacteriota bacterium]